MKIRIFLTLLALVLLHGEAFTSEVSTLKKRKDANRAAREAAKADGQSSEPMSAQADSEDDADKSTSNEKKKEEMLDFKKLAKANRKQRADEAKSKNRKPSEKKRVNLYVYLDKITDKDFENADIQWELYEEGQEVNSLVRQLGDLIERSSAVNTPEQIKEFGHKVLSITQALVNYLGAEDKELITKHVNQLLNLLNTANPSFVNILKASKKLAERTEDTLKKHAENNLGGKIEAAKNNNKLDPKLAAKLNQNDGSAASLDLGGEEIEEKAAEAKNSKKSKSKKSKSTQN